VLAVVNAVKDRGAGVAANRTKAVISKMFAWGVQEGHVETNPAKDIPRRAQELARERALNPSEIAAFWHGLDESGLSLPVKSALRLALVTGQRIGEVCNAEIGHLDLVKRVWNIPSSHTKNQKRHVVPLSPFAMDLFADAIKAGNGTKYVFPSTSATGHLEPHSLSTGMRRARASLGLADNPATPHDLRRTVATQMAGQGVPEDIVSRILNHAQGAKRTVTSTVYIQFDFMDEKRKAMDNWSARLQGIINGEAALAA
jgi:integrase